jgi:hypothetical protein
MEEIALEFPNAKKEACWRRREVVVTSMADRSRSARRDSWIVNKRSSGMLVARDCVMWKSVRRSWIDRNVAD